MSRVTTMRGHYLLGATLLLLACGERDAATAQATSITSRDSAGVAIVEHPPGALAAAPLYGLGKPILTIGGASVDSLHDATFLTDASFVDNNRFVTVDRRSWQMALFDSSGTVVATYGRRGDGPGEFRDYPTPQRAADGSLWTMNFPARVMRFTPELQLLTDRTLGFGGASDQLLRPVHPDAVLAVSRAPILPKSVSEPVQRTAEYLVRIDASRRDTLATWPGMEWYPVAGNEGGTHFIGYDQPYFGKSSLVELWGDQLVIGTNDGWVLDVRDTTGALRRRIVLHESAQPVTELMRDSVRTQQRARIEEWNAPAAAKVAPLAAINTLRFADSVAWYQAAHAANDGALWVAETVVPTENTRHYAVFDASGRLTRRVMMPARYRLLAADGDRVLVRRLDPDGIGYIDLVRIVPTAK
jgi:hypothetical protein